VTYCLCDISCFSILPHKSTDRLLYRVISALSRNFVRGRMLWDTADYSLWLGGQKLPDCSYSSTGGEARERQVSGRGNKRERCCYVRMGHCRGLVLTFCLSNSSKLTRLERCNPYKSTNNAFFANFELLMLYFTKKSIPHRA
jgi:hypothetical protein